jgi:ABC-type glycerol-3-phosphate transport system permease component
MTEASPSRGSILQGLLLCWGMNFVQVLLGCSVAWIEAERPGGSNTVVYIAVAMALSAGLLQLLYLIPLWRVLKTNGKTQTIKGVIIAACVTALLNAVWLMFKAIQ